MIDFSKPVKTRNGLKVRIYTTNHPNKTYPIIGCVEGDDYPNIWTKNGQFWHANPNRESPLDLVQVEPEYWINVYRSPEDFFYVSRVLFSEEETNAPEVDKPLFARLKFKKGDGLWACNSKLQESRQTRVDESIMGTIPKKLDQKIRRRIKRAISNPQEKVHRVVKKGEKIYGYVLKYHEKEVVNFMVTSNGRLRRIS